MPEHFLYLPARDRRDILLSAVGELGKPMALLEKDVWVCWVLQTLFSLPNAHPMAFKGGTSLSKILGAINRFSEDVDVTLDYREFEDGFDPFAEGASRTAIKKFGERLKGYVRDYAHDVIVPHVRSKLEELPEPEESMLELSDDGEKIRVRYPSVTKSGNDYLTNDILIELGGRNVICPNERHVVKSDISMLDVDLVFPSGSVVVLSPERTFWEKATLIHVECHRKEFKSDANRLSRHWYDLWMLAKHDVGKAAIKNYNLLEDVVRHKRIFYHYGFVDYNDCLDNRLCLVPEETATILLQEDYQKMLDNGMIYGDPPSFGDIIEGIRDIEREANNR
ncbi:MAG: nucleotidyl transferase AbiEii/AbiGii toxin family protein [Rhodobacteraceae bacterium]|nr:nucleotidyl transferase AbiEii/AbiGii toxin family protein [Paracoccaceae bacterium]